MTTLPWGHAAVPECPLSPTAPALRPGPQCHPAHCLALETRLELAAPLGSDLWVLKALYAFGASAAQGSGHRKESQRAFFTFCTSQMHPLGFWPAAHKAPH